MKNLKKAIFVMIMTVIVMTGCSSKIGSEALSGLFMSEESIEHEAINTSSIESMDFADLNKEEKKYLKTVYDILEDYKENFEDVIETNRVLVSQESDIESVKEEYQKEANTISLVNEAMLPLNPPERFKQFHYGFYNVLDKHEVYLTTVSEKLEANREDQIGGITHSTTMFVNAYNKAIGDLANSLDKNFTVKTSGN